jgi:hypothetical protein
MRLDRYGLAALLACLTLTPALVRAAASAESSPRVHLEREDLLGTWRLARMSYSGLNGSHVDPFRAREDLGACGRGTLEGPPITREWRVVHGAPEAAQILVPAGNVRTRRGDAQVAQYLERAQQHGERWAACGDALQALTVE